MAIAEGLGATVTWSGVGATGFSGNIISIEPPDWELPLIDTTHLGTTGSFKTNIPATLADPGQVVITAQYDPATTIPVLGETGTLLITFVNQGGSTYTGSATLIGVTPPAPAVEELMVITLTFAYDGITGPTETWGV